MYFGDEDPALLADQRKTLLSNLPSFQPESHLKPQATPTKCSREGDLVLLFSEESGSFEYSEGGMAADLSERDILPATSNAEVSSITKYLGLFRLYCHTCV
jgi:hypothetical protein